MTYFICLKTIVTVLKYNEFVDKCTSGEIKYGIYNSLWMIFEFILSFITCFFLILVSNGWGIVHANFNPNDMKSITYLCFCISLFAVLLSDKNMYVMMFIILMYVYIMYILVNSSRPITRSLKYYINLLEENIPLGDFTYHHNTLKLNLLKRLILCGNLMLTSSMIMYLLTYVMGDHYILWLIFDEFFDLVTISPMLYSLRLRVINRSGIQLSTDRQREAAITEENTTENNTTQEPNNNEQEMCVNNQPELQKFYLIITTDKNMKHTQNTTLLAEVIEN
ncbi:hypothetical protein U3516DRAFT_774771 [Neocallimastix sp. 'constans']|jgi:hypothetical protein